MDSLTTLINSNLQLGSKSLISCLKIRSSIVNSIKEVLVNKYGFLELSDQELLELAKQFGIVPHEIDLDSFKQDQVSRECTLQTASRMYEVDIFTSSVLDQVLTKQEEFSFVIEKNSSKTLNYESLSQSISFSEAIVKQFLVNLIKYNKYEVKDLGHTSSYIDTVIQNNFIRITYDEARSLLNKDKKHTLSSQDKVEVTKYFCNMPVFLMDKDEFELLLPEAETCLKSSLYEHKSMVPFSKPTTHCTIYLSCSKFMKFISQ